MVPTHHTVVEWTLLQSEPTTTTYYHQLVFSHSCPEQHLRKPNVVKYQTGDLATVVLSLVTFGDLFQSNLCLWSVFASYSWWRSAQKSK